ncbi:hypothetical protein M569_04404, partial [Genlisea aurea]
YNQPVAERRPYASPNSQIKISDDADGQERYFTLESSPAINFGSSSSAVISSIRSPFSPQGSQYSCTSDYHQSSDITTATTYCSSPGSGSSGNVDVNKWIYALQALSNELLGPEMDIDDGCSFEDPRSSYAEILERAPGMDLKELLMACAEVVENVKSSHDEQQVAIDLMDKLEDLVSVCGDPLQRLGAYMLEGIRARLLESGSVIYKKLKCREPINPSSADLMSYMHVIYQICPYYKFAYVSSTVIIDEATKDENSIHIIDFQIAQGSQWASFVQSVARRRPPPFIRITGVDDPQSAHARGGGLHLVGKRLADLADSCGVPFEFHGAAINGTEVSREDIEIRHGEAVAVNFPYVLHHMPDESVTTENHRDRLLHLVKSLSPRVVTLVEQESNTNTSSFRNRFREALEYYSAMFESIDAARPREDRMRISTEENCIARDIVNIVACEGRERVERHEPFGKWRMRLSMAGFSPVRLDQAAENAAVEMLKEYSSNYRVGEENGALYLWWKERAMSTCSAWR